MQKGIHIRTPPTRNSFAASASLRRSGLFIGDSSLPAGRRIVRRATTAALSDALQQRSKLLDGKARVAGNPAHRERVDRIVAGNGHDASAVAHDNVLPLTQDPKPRFFESAYGVEVI